MEEISHRGWSLNGLHKPAAFHIALTLRHTQPGVPERFLQDLEAAVARVRAEPDRQTGMAPIYGMAAAAPSEMVSQMLRSYIDLLYKV